MDNGLYCLLYCWAMRVRLMPMLLVAALAALLAGCEKSRQSPPDGPRAPAADQSGSEPLSSLPAPWVFGDPLEELSPPPAEPSPAEPVSIAEAVRAAVLQAPDGIHRAAMLALHDAARDPRAQMAAGDRALALGQTTLAVECFYRAVALAPEDPDGLKGLTIALTAAGRYAEALPLYEMLLGMQPSDEAARFNYAVALSRERRLASACEQYRNILGHRPQHLRARYNLAALLQAQGKLSEALAEWSAVLEQAGELAAPDAAAAYLAYADCLGAADKAPQAMEACAAAARLRPDDPLAWLRLSEAATAAGSMGRAIVAARKAADLQPMDTQTWNRLAEQWLALHRATNDRSHLGQAVACWQISLRLRSNQPEVARLVSFYSAAASAPASGPATAASD
jgi:tetratricopeptide (TPR) repeat protein